MKTLQRDASVEESSRVFRRPEMRLAWAGALMLVTSVSSAGCGLILGLDSYAVDDTDGPKGGNGEPIPCDSNADCDDNECATGTCEDSECVFRALTAGTECSDGVCDGSTGSPSCQRCIDDAGGDSRDTGCPEGAPQCAIDGEAVCIGCDSGSDCDDGDGCNTDTCTDGVCTYSGGCEGDTPVCDDGQCVQCVTDGDCDDDIGCTEEVCSNGTCLRDFHDEDCPASGSLCVRATCTETGCMDVDVGIASATELLVNGSLDEGTVWTYATLPSDWDVLTPPTAGVALSAPNIGNLVTGFVNAQPDDDGELAYIYQDVDVPTGIDGLRASGYYRSYAIVPSDNTVGDDNDFVGVGFWSSDSESWYQVEYFSKDAPVVEEWTQFEVLFDVDSVPDGTVEFNAIGEGDGLSPHVSYYIDDISLEAIVCNE